MNIPTINSQEFLEAFQRGDYPAMVHIANSFAQTLALDAAHDTKLLSNVSANFLTQQQEENERNNPSTNYV